MASKKQDEQYDVESKNYSIVNVGITLILIISALALLLFLING